MINNYNASKVNNVANLTYM